MKNIRIIPKIDIKGPNLVKGIHLEGLRVLGSPRKFAQLYYESGADELIYMDVVASLYNRNSILNMIKETARQIFIPLTVGGGLRTLDDIKNALRAGADKVSLNTAAIKNPKIISEASKKFGSSTILVVIEAIKQPNGEYMAFIENGREFTGKEAISWAKEVEKLGAGEIMLTSVDKEGTGLGYDIELTKAVVESVSIPVIACGGPGKLEDIEDVIKNGKADAVCISSMLHYHAIEDGRKVSASKKSSEGNFEFLKTNQKFGKIKPATIPEIKKYLFGKNINCRI